MNRPVLRGDIARVERCTAITTGSGGEGKAVKRSKPFKYAYEKEIVMYAYFKVSLPCSPSSVHEPEYTLVETGLPLDRVHILSYSV